MSEPSPLMLACLSIDGDAETVKALVAEGVDVNAANEDGYSALHYAAMADWNENEDGRMRVLLNARPDLEARANTQSGNSWTPLMLAAEEGHSAQVTTLIEAGANIEATGDDGRTPLMLAAAQDWEPSAKVEALLNAGADSHKRCLAGKTALSYASENLNVLNEVDSCELSKMKTECLRVIELLKSATSS